MQPEPTKQSICKALFVCYNSSSSKSERNAADTYLQSIKKSKNGLKLSIHLFANTMDPPVLFYCLHVIEHSIDKRWHELDNECVILLNQLLLSFIRQVCSKDNLFASIPAHVREKIAQILVKLMKKQYLISWDSFFSDLIEILKHNNNSDGLTHGVWDIFYRILQDLNWSIHENRNEGREELTLNNKIKDRMRQYDVQQIVEIWYLFLTNYSKYDIKLCQQCLITMDKYISWIDISYISAPRFLNILYKFLEIVSFQNESVDCLYEIVTKRMDYTKKFELIQSIKILSIMNKIEINGTNDEKLRFAESITGLIEGIGIELTGCCKDNVQNAQFVIFECYDLSLKYFSHPSYKVNQECCTFLFAFWNMIKRQNDRNKNKNKNRTNTNTNININTSVSENINININININEREQALFNKTVELISNHLCYPVEYDINDPDEAEAEFDEYRKEQLNKLITSMTRTYPHYMLNLIGNHFSKTCQIISQHDGNTIASYSNGNINGNDRKSNDNVLQLRWQNIESDLHLIYKICEGFHHKNIDQLIRNNNKLINLFEYSLKANICTKHPHPKILLKYFEIIHRYNVFFESHPEYISQVLQLFVLCIQQNNNNNNNNTLRGHSAYTLQKLISKLYALNSNKVNVVLLQYMDQLIQSLGSCLSIYIQQKRNLDINQLQQFDSNDIKNICGVLGQLVLLNKNNKNKLYQHCNKICGIFMNELKHYIINRNEWINVNRMLISQIMSQYISCVQSFFKPFGFVNSNKNNSECIKNILIEFTDIVIQCYSCLPNDDELRQVSIGFVHKMVYILRNNIINQLNSALKLYIEYLNTNNCVFTLQIITNIVASLRSNIVPILDNMFYPLFEKIINILSGFNHDHNNGFIGHGQDIISKNDIEKHLYLFLLKTYQSGCFEIFLSNNNGRHFDKVINFIFDGCVIKSYDKEKETESYDATIYKTCFTILKEMLSALKNTHPSMKDLFCNKVVKISFEFALSPNFKEKKPEYNRTLKTHIFGIHHLMFDIFGNDVITNCIGGYLVTQLNLDTNTAKKYCDLCIKGNQQRKLKDIILSLRSMSNFKTNNNDYQTNQH